MDVDDLKYIGNTQIIYPNQEKRFDMKTYISNKICGVPEEFEENDSNWILIDELIKSEKRFAITYLMDENIIKYFKKENFNITFICDDNHNIIDMKIQ